MERLWEWIKENFLGKSIFIEIENIFQAGVSNWNNLTDDLVRSTCRVKWLPRTN
ncbi:MAG: hypothetical protein HQM08_25650 [Candidatus Riflebacteria bacterium]|nr:hypothetical protein [Candidatus Riflebacteria bacterium]